MSVSGWAAAPVILCAFMLAAAPPAPVTAVSVQDGDAPDSGMAGPCADGMETAPYTDDLDALPVSGAQDEFCGVQDPVAI